MVALFILLFIILALTVDYGLQCAAKRKETVVGESVSMASPLVAAAPMTPLPQNLFFDQTHTWVHVPAQGPVGIGVDHLVTDVIGQPERISVPPVGTVIKRGQPLITVTRKGRTLVARAPLSGTVAHINEQLVQSPTALCDRLTAKQWLVRVDPDRLSGTLKHFRVAEDAADWMKGELGRLRDTLVQLVQTPAAVGVTAADGGIPLNDISERLDDAAWEQLTKSIFEGATEK